MSRLSQEFGMSDVGLAKICKRYEIPRPPRGYWARIANGYKDRKTPLPKGENAQIEFDIKENQKKQAAIEKKQQAERERTSLIQPAIEMSQNLMHPLAQKLQDRLKKTSPNKDGILKPKGAGLPDIEVTDDSGDRVLRFLSIVAYAVTELGINIAKDKEKRTLLFERDGYSVGLAIFHEKIEDEREPTLEEKRNPNWTWNLRFQRIADELTIILHSPSGVHGRKKWTESRTFNIVDLAPKIAARIDRILTKFEEDRLAQVKREEEWELQRQRWKIESQERERLDRVKKIKEGRARELLRASMLWQERKNVLEYIQECEQRWKNPSPEQLEWLEWAKKVAERLNPLSYDYPDPRQHGQLDESTVSHKGYFKGEERVLPDIQILEDIKKLSERRGGYSSW